MGRTVNRLDIQPDIFRVDHPYEFPWKRSLSEQVFDRLRGAIIRGDISSEGRLVESRIAELLGISRTPVREALFKLEKEGLIKRLPGGGFSVVDLTEEELEETFGIRSVLESYAARLGAIKYKEGELEPLEEKVREFQYQLDNGNMEQLLSINTQFHDMLYALSRSPRLIRMINELRDQIFRFRKIILRKRETAIISNNDHREMIEAMKKRDADRVESLVRDHILRGRELVMKNLRNMKK